MILFVVQKLGKKAIGKRSFMSRQMNGGVYCIHSVEHASSSGQRTIRSQNLCRLDCIALVNTFLQVITSDLISPPFCLCKRVGIA